MKPRSDAKIESLPPGRREYVRRWLFVDKLSCAEVSARCQKEFGLLLSSEAVRRWYAKVEKELLAERALKAALDRAAESATTASATVRALEELKDPYWTALMGQIGQNAFELKMKGQAMEIPQLKDLADIAALGLKAKYDTAKLAQKEREVLLAEKTFMLKFAEGFLKWFEDKRAKDIASSTSDNSEKINKLGELMFGPDWKE